MAFNKFLQRYEKKEVRTAGLFLAPLLIIVAVFILLPVIGTVYNSFFLDVSFLPKQFIGIKNYSQLLSSPDFWHTLRFTLAYAMAAVFLEAVLGIIFALLLNEAFPGRNFLRVVVLIPWAIPTIVSARTWQLIYEYTYGVMNFLVVNLGIAPERINWMGTGFGAFWALVLADVWKTTPFVVLILLAGLAGHSGRPLSAGKGGWRRPVPALFQDHPADAQAGSGDRPDFQNHRFSANV